MIIKKELYKQCETYLNKRSETLDQAMDSHRKSLETESKSSAGDKHETGRAMVQLEMEKASQQIEAIRSMRETLNRINLEKTSQKAVLGSVVSTNFGSYFLAIGAGQLLVGAETFFAVSLSSPIGNQMLGKAEGDRFIFNGRKFEVQRLV